MTEQIAEPVVPQFELPDRMRRALRHADVSSIEMAEYLEVTRHTISNWINGHTRPRPAELKMWALRTGVDYKWLITGASRQVADDFGPPADFMVNADKPSGMHVNPYVPRPSDDEIMRFRKRIPPKPRTAEPADRRMVAAS